MESTTHGWEGEALSHIWNMKLQRHQQAKPGGGEIPILPDKLRVRHEVLFTESETQVPRCCAGRYDGRMEALRDPSAEFTSNTSG